MAITDIVNDELVEALEAIAQALDGDRDRLGRLKLDFGAGEPLRRLAVRYQVGGALDTMHQVVLVARAVLAEVKP